MSSIHRFSRLRSLQVIIPSTENPSPLPSPSGLKVEILEHKNEYSPQLSTIAMPPPCRPMHSAPRVKAVPPLLPPELDQLGLPHCDHGDLPQRLALAHDPSVRTKNWMQAHGGDAQRNSYAYAFWQAVLDATRVLDQGNLSGETIIQMLGARRQQIAKERGDPNAEDFGRTTSKRRATPVAGRYAELEGAKDFMLACRRGNLSELYGEHNVRRTTHISDALPRWRVLGTLSDGSKVKLTKIRWEPGHEFSEDEPFIPAWETPPVQRPAVKRHINFLFDRALRRSPQCDKKSLVELLPEVASLHWWLAHDAPFKRGTGGVADMLSAALLWHHGWQWTGWRDGVAADVVALMIPHEQMYADKYPTLFRSEPTPAQLKPESGGSASSTGPSP